MMTNYFVKLKIVYNSIKGKKMQDRKNRTLRDDCYSKKHEKTKETSSLNRDKELDSLREKQKKDDELQKDTFDMIVELSGLGN